MSTPLYRHGETAKEYSSDLKSVSSDAKRKLAAIEPNDRFVQSRCDQLGRPINA